MSSTDEIVSESSVVVRKEVFFVTKDPKTKQSTTYISCTSNDIDDDYCSCDERHCCVDCLYSDYD
jgi:hypothetical protein